MIGFPSNVRWKSWYYPGCGVPIVNQSFYIGQECKVVCVVIVLPCHNGVAGAGAAAGACRLTSNDAALLACIGQPDPTGGAFSYPGFWVPRAPAANAPTNATTLVLPVNASVQPDAYLRVLPMAVNLPAFWLAVGYEV